MISLYSILRTKRDIAKILTDFESMKSDRYVVKFWRKLENFHFLPG